MICVLIRANISMLEFARIFAQIFVKMIVHALICALTCAKISENIYAHLDLR